MFSAFFLTVWRLTGSLFFLIVTNSKPTLYLQNGSGWKHTLIQFFSCADILEIWFKMLLDLDGNLATAIQYIIIIEISNI